MRKLTLILSILFILLLPVPVYAHAFGQRYDLPIPLSYFMAGAAATVALSFVVIGIFLRGGSAQFRYPRFNLLSLPGATLTSRIKILVAQVISVLLLLLVLATSLFGSDNPLANFSPTFVWIIWWVGMGYIAALFGNLWMLINPWKGLYEWTEWLLKRAGAKIPFALSLSNGMSAGLRPYPAGWDSMPALIAFLAFVWLENVYPGSIIPRYLGSITVAYSVYTLGGMLLYGKHVWLRYGDPFAVLFGIFARFSPTEVRVVGGNCDECELDCAPHRTMGMTTAWTATPATSAQSSAVGKRTPSPLMGEGRDGGVRQSPRSSTSDPGQPASFQPDVYRGRPAPSSSSPSPP